MNIFELLIWGIIAIILLGIGISFFNQTNQVTNINTEIENALQFAQTNEKLGQIVTLNSRKIESDYLLLKKDFETNNQSIALECTNPNLCCPNKEKCDKIEWDFEKIKFKNERSYDFFIRCVRDNIFICRIYFGQMPAQAKINEIKILDDQGTSTKFNVIVTNSGKINLFQGENSIVLYKKVKNDWEKTPEVFPIQNISMLMPNQTHTFLWNIETKTSGEYRAESKFLGENSGFEIKQYDFNVTENSFCIIDETKTQTIFDNTTQKYREIHYCNNCNYSFECVTEWAKENPDIIWNIIDKEKIFCEKNLLQETC
ncbi:MAG: hypothetical protein PHX27_01885 [Candidatus ainarchaeum sp.]|nr:hypothetical protein [Candidatus ainarchaeum sp.]